MADQGSIELESAPKAASRLMELALNATHLGVVVCDMSGKVSYFNPAAEKISGVSVEDALAADTGADIFPNPSENQYLAETLLKHGKVEGHRLFFPHTKTGDPIVAELYATLLYENDTPVGSLWIIVDKSEESRVLNELIHSEKMATLSQLSFGIAHEFNNIIAGLQGFAQLAKLPGKDNRLQQLPDMVITYSERAKEVVDNLFAFSGASDSEIAIAVDVNKIVELTLKLILRDLERHEINVTLDLSELPAISTDVDKLKHVLLNLFMNARNAMKTGGKLTIATIQQGDFIRIDVSDTGKGFPESMLPHIFEPFYTTRRYLQEGEEGGLGLGLSACYGMMRDLGGDIKVETEQGKGSTIKVFLPVSVRKPVTSVGKGALHIDGVPVKKSSMRILIADDEETIRMSLVEFLNEMGYETQAEASGHEALKAAESNDWDVAVFDITMPGGGIEAVRELRRLCPDIKIFIITGHGGSYLGELRKECEAQDLGQIFPKPFNLKDLLVAIEKSFVSV